MSSYAAAIHAFDAAGNPSAQTAYVVETEACEADLRHAAAVGAHAAADHRHHADDDRDGLEPVDRQWSRRGIRALARRRQGRQRRPIRRTGTQTSPAGRLTLSASSRTTPRGTGPIAAYASGPASTSACPPAPAPPAPAPPPDEQPPATPPPPAVDGQAPSTPRAPSVSASGQTSLTLTWTASTDNVGVAGYAVSRSAQAGTTTGTSYTVTGLSCGVTYTLGVEAYDAAGNQSARAAVSAATQSCPDTQPPTQPANVTQTEPDRVKLVRPVGRVDRQHRRGRLLGSQCWNPGGDGDGNDVHLHRPHMQYHATRLAVDAFDASAHHSAQAVVMMTTSPCMDTAAAFGADRAAGRRRDRRRRP